MAKKFDRLLEGATDSTLLEPNWTGIVDCCDSIRGGEVPAKLAMPVIRKRLRHENPHVIQHTLLVLDACVKNCGQKFHSEVATREFMEEFKNLGIENKFEAVRNKVLEMLQCWAMAFANKPDFKIVVDTHNLMKLAGFDFPSIKEADAMFLAQVAPEWQEGDACFRCRAEFGLITRKHHCRACGQIFCDKCSSQEMPLPQFGIEKEVRVCDACFEKAPHPKAADKVVKSEPGQKSTTVVIKDVDEKEKEKLRREKEEEDLALALAISQSEADAKEKERQNNLYSIYNGDATAPLNDATSLSSYHPSETGGYRGVAARAPSIPESVSENSMNDADPLARYLNRDYWQQRKEGVNQKVEEWGGADVSAPLPSESSFASVSAAATVVDDSPSIARFAQMGLLQNGGGLDNSSLPQSADEEEARKETASTMQWCEQVKEQVGVMENRIRSNNARGRLVLNDSAIQGLFMRLTEMHAQVLSRMTKLDSQRTYYESLQDHLAHIGEARSAVDQLRAQHEKQEQERLAEEQRQRQVQMKQTLELMRMKKHAMLMEQRDQALQRFQMQEMQARRQPVQQVPMYYPPNSGYAAVQPQTNLPQHYAQAPGQPVNYPASYAPTQQVSQYSTAPNQQQYQNGYTSNTGVYSQPDSNQINSAVNHPQSNIAYTPQPNVGHSVSHHQNVGPSQQGSYAPPPPPQQQQYYQQPQYQQSFQQPDLNSSSTTHAPLSVPPQNYQTQNLDSSAPSAVIQESAIPDAPLISFD